MCPGRCKLEYREIRRKWQGVAGYWARELFRDFEFYSVGGKESLKHFYQGSSMITFAI